MTAAADSIAPLQHPHNVSLNRTTLRIGLLGLGQVGRAVVRTAARAIELLPAHGVELRVVRALVRDVSRHRPDAPNISEVTNDPESFFRLSYDVVVEVLGGVEPARALVTRALETGTPVVTANKSLMAAHGEELRALAARHGTRIRYEASVLAGVPFLGALELRPLASSFDRLTGIVNGTSNFILSSMSQENVSFGEALRKAQALGLAEPDPASDICGVDAAEKLAVLLQQFSPGSVRSAGIETMGIEQVAADDLAQARAFGGVIKPVACAAWGTEGIAAFVGPAFLTAGHPLAKIEGLLNGLCLHSRLVGDLFYSGPGAGPDVTAATILDDVVEVATLRRRAASPRSPAVNAPNAECRPPRTGWFLRMTSVASLPDVVELSEFLGSHGVWFSRTSVHRRNGCEALYGLTHPCSREHLERALAAVRAATGCQTFQIRTLEA